MDETEENLRRQQEEEMAENGMEAQPAEESAGATPEPMPGQANPETASGPATQSGMGDGQGIGPVPQEQAPGEPVPQQQPAEQPIFTQSQVNDLIGKTRMEARQKAMEEARQQYDKDLWGHYGVDDAAGLDELVGNGQRYQAMSDEYDSQSHELSDLRAENALLKAGVDQSRFSDVKAVAAYNHIDVTPETIAQLLTTHPEWRQGGGMPPVGQTPLPPQAPSAQQPQPQQPPAMVRKAGGEPTAANPAKDDEAEAMRLFGLDN